MRSMIAATAAAVCLSAPAQAAETVFLQLVSNGGEIEGEVTDSGFEGALEVFSMSLSGEAGGQAGAGRARSRTNYPPISFTVMRGQAMPLLFQALARGERLEGTFSLIGLEQDGVMAVQQRIDIEGGRILSVELVTDAMDTMPGAVQVQMAWSKLTMTDIDSGNEVEIDWTSGR